MFHSLTRGHYHKIAGGVLAVYGGMNLYNDYKSPAPAGWMAWVGDGLTFAIGVSLFF